MARGSPASPVGPEASLMLEGLKGLEALQEPFLLAPTHRAKAGVITVGPPVAPWVRGGVGNKKWGSFRADGLIVCLSHLILGWNS